MAVAERAKVDRCECGGHKVDGVCLNVNCSVAQAEATKDAARSTAKSTAPGAKTTTVESVPRSFNISGRVD